MFKNKIRSLFPGLYQRIWRLKEYLRTGKLPRRWSHYYDASTTKIPQMTEPFPELANLKLPGYIDTILDVGCASGRSFIPFNGKLKLWGVDIVPERRIQWVRTFNDLTYENITVEKLTERLERRPIDMSHTFVFASGTLMYVPEEYQHRFFNICRRLGCKNFMFLDYPPNTLGYERDHFRLPEDLFVMTDSSANPKLKVYTLMDRNN